MHRHNRYRKRKTGKSWEPEHLRFPGGRERVIIHRLPLTAVIEGTATSFTPLEFKLLKLLSLNPNTVLTRQHLLYSLWDRNGNYVEETSLNSMICRIRQRIDTENHHYIKTIYGIGYMWTFPS